MSAAPLLAAEAVSVRYPGRDGRTVAAVSAVSLTLARGETLALVGESGSGKSSLGRALLQLRRPDAGRVLFDGVDLTRLDEPALRPLRRRLQIVLQNPLAALNPRMTVGAAIADPIRQHRLAPPDGVAARVTALLDRVGLGPRFVHHYPHQLSGGQCQRVVIARALACEPDLIVCDEPTSALDVSIRAQILNLLRDLQDERGLAYLLITHDLGIVRQVADRAAVLYLGRVVETAPTARLFAAAAHPYTRALLAALPVLGQPPAEIRDSGQSADPSRPPPGCPFHPRCDRATPRCHIEIPEPHTRADGHTVACHHPHTDPQEATP